MDDRALLELAVEASTCAYAPYSGYAVGAAVLTRDGLVLSGTNVENASYGLSLCAERVALSSAVVRGVRPGDVEAIAVTTAPCGACRQWLVEFGVGRVIFPTVTGETVVRRPEELLPDAFELPR